MRDYNEHKDFLHTETGVKFKKYLIIGIVLLNVGFLIGYVNSFNGNEPISINIFIINFVGLILDAIGGHCCGIYYGAYKLYMMNNKK